MTYVRFVLSTAVCAIVLAGCIPPVDSLDAPAPRYESPDGQYWLEFTGEDRVEFRLDVPTHDEHDEFHCDADGEGVTEGSSEMSMTEPYQMSVFHDVDHIRSPILIYLEGSGDWGRLWVRPCGLDHEGVALLPMGLPKGPHTVEVEVLLRDTPGWRVETLGKGSARGQVWVFRRYNDRGHPTGPQLRWHPGGGHHGPIPYWRVIGDSGDVARVIRW